MSNYHVVDNFLNQVTEYEELNAILLQKIKKQKKINDEEYVELENGLNIFLLNNGFDGYQDNNRIVYAAVYECRERLAYDERTLRGFICLNYDYTEYL